LLLLCGEIDVKLSSDCVILDRKLKFRCSPKSNIALKYLRDQLTQILSCRMRMRPLTKAQEAWYSLALMILGRVVDEGEDQTIKARIEGAA